LNRIAVEDGRFADRRGDGAERTFEQLPAPGPLLLRRELRVTCRKGDAARGDDARRADAARDRDEVAQQRGGDPGALQLFRER
jgi:hypothetical protein